MTIERVLLPDTEIADGVRMLLPDLMFTSFTEAERAFVRAQDRAVWNHTRVGGLARSRAVSLGHGAIGKAIACRLEPFDVQVIGVTLSGRDNTVPMAEVDHVLSDCEILIITLPLTPSTRGVVDATLSRLPDGDELWGLPNVVVMPHVGGHSDLFPGSASALLASQIQRYLSDAHSSTR
jgi:phosphoglycerate dehydrogenase-like enzyme